MLDQLGVMVQWAVVLLAEDVDRNRWERVDSIKNAPSSSSRRTWIEIKEALNRLKSQLSRPPRGGRG